MKKVTDDSVVNSLFPTRSFVINITHQIQFMSFATFEEGDDYTYKSKRKIIFHVSVHAVRMRSTYSNSDEIIICESCSQHEEFISIYPKHSIMMKDLNEIEVM